MARAILVTMSHNLLAKIEYSSLVMRQVSGRRPELIRARRGIEHISEFGCIGLEKQELFKTPLQGFE